MHRLKPGQHTLIVLAGTDFGGSQRQLASLFADLGSEIAGQFAGMLAPAGLQTPDTRAQRRELTRRVIALDPAVDRATLAGIAVGGGGPIHGA